MARESKKTTVVQSKRRTWLILAVLAAAFACTALMAHEIRNYGMSSPGFVLNCDHADALTIEGLSYASHARVTHVFADDFGHSIFSIPLDSRRRRLLAIDWVEDSTVSRVWPDRLIVRIRERKPVAFVFFRSGVFLIDAYGVLLDRPPQSQFTFPVLSGVREDLTEQQRGENVRILLRLQRELGSHAGDISEVNTADPENIRLVARVDNQAVDLLLGDTNFGNRYTTFLNHYPEIHRKSPEARVFDLRLDDRITARESRD